MFWRYLTSYRRGPGAFGMAATSACQHVEEQWKPLVESSAQPESLDLASNDHGLRRINDRMMLIEDGLESAQDKATYAFTEKKALPHLRNEP